MGGGLVRLGGEFLLCPRCGGDNLCHGRVVLYTGAWCSTCAERTT
jgi:hypothetical protein